jgi:hypothetical protein
MKRPKENPNEQTRRSRHQTSNRKNKPGQNSEDFDRTIPGRRTPEYERFSNRTVNEDEQKKAVNNPEDNAQSRGEISENENTSDTQAPYDEENSNERLEAGDDQSEVNPRSPKVN